ncbi:MAG: DUF4956 domain-containing protein [Verrucomicrobia bacterium]|nr:MAG: DUF4956 domain-containing protein [Verrucomicrobiota bacterium]
MDSILRGDYGIAPTNLPALGLGVLLAFLSAQLLAWVYMFTHSGVSYSRSFVVSLLLMPVIIALVMTVLANNLITAFGMMAVFAIVRFRNILRDTLDAAYVLAALVVGMACGMARFTTVIVGTAVICGILLYVWLTGFGSRHRFDLVLNLCWLRPLAEIRELDRVLERHCQRVTCANQRRAADGTGTIFAYRVLLRNPARSAELLDEVAALAGVQDVTSARVGDESEV